MRTSKREKLVLVQREELEAKRSTISKLRKEKRREKGRAEDIAKAIKRSPEGRKAAETRVATRGVARRQEQANYQKRRTRAAARLGGRRKQIEGELHNKREV
jgi:hypothetical protein